MQILSYVVFYLVQLTWGILMNIVGGLAALGLLITGHRPYYFAPYIYFRTKWNFGGLNLGFFFIIGKDCDSCAPHEMGHGIQNMWLGPLLPFVVSIPSALRYWLRMQNNTASMDGFTWIVGVVGVVIVTALGILGVALNWFVLAWICLVLFIYIVGLTVWALCIEIPKYVNGFTPYDSIWFEGSATKLGNDKFAANWWLHVQTRK